MQKASKTLPDTYQQDSQFNMKDPKRLIWLNAVGLGLAIFFFWLFLTLLAWIRPGMKSGIRVQFDSLNSLLFVTAAILATAVFVLLLHEAVHGLFFWFYARHRPLFGVGLTYAFAAMPGWYFPRNQFMIIGAAPLALITTLGLILATIVPIQFMGYLLLALVMNAAGAVGDLAVLGWLLTKPKSALASDEGHRIVVFTSST